MNKFIFDKDSIKKIKCIYTYDDKVDENTLWEGYIVTQNVDGVLNIEGYEIDKVDSLERDGSLHKRYILGKKAISNTDESLLFEIYPGKIAPIHYDMRYHESDGCFYGCWFLSPSKNHPHPFGGQGRAIICIEDVMIEEKEVTETIKKVAERSKNEYSEEICDYLLKKQISVFDSAPAVKKLSKYSDIIKK